MIFVVIKDRYGGSAVFLSYYLSLIVIYVFKIADIVVIISFFHSACIII